VAVKVPLIAHLAKGCATLSSERSCLTPIDEGDDAFWTDTVRIDVQLVGDLGLFAGGRSSVFEEHPEVEHRAESNLAVFRKRMKKEKDKRTLGGRKGKESLLQLATFPMILFLGLPALRKWVLLLRDQLNAAVLRHLKDPGHRSIATAERRYHRALLQYIVFAFFYADGLRLANYTHARLGSARKDDGLVGDVAQCGARVRSYTHIEPQLEGDRIVGVRTNFFGDDHARVKLKIDKVPGSNEPRSRPHWIRPGLLDMDLFHEFLTDVRARSLAEQGLISDANAYDLEDDIDRHHFALFVSPSASTDPYRAVTGAYGPQAIELIFGQTLHWVCTKVLGRELPPFNSPELKAKYPRVFAPHVARLQAGSHIYGILDRADQAQTLLNDTLATVKKRYTVVEASMVHKTGWEAPHFFDELFERVWDKNEAVDWDVEDPLDDLPENQRPPGLDSVV
jgi:hypothetical protein